MLSIAQKLIQGEERLPQLLRFGGTTLLSACLTFFLPILLHELLGIPARAAVAAAFITVFCVNFVMLRIIVFRTGQRGWMTDFRRYGLTSAGFRLAEYGAFLLLNESAKLDYRLSLLVVLVTSTIIKFFAYRFLFRERRQG